MERTTEKVFPNGDIYVGTIKGVLPHDKGRYTWSDGTVYDGHWAEGKMDGKGWIIWSSGSSYEGEFCVNYLHGYGAFYGCDGSIYRGSWKMNNKHGIGRKEYHNSDVYDGCWREGVREGSGRYAWSNGNCYIGNWKNGKTYGRGVMKWSNGDIFDGFWSNGLRNGSGCYRFADGSYFFGTWAKGIKDGRGTFYPSGSKLSSLDKTKIDKHQDFIKRMLSHRSSVSADMLDRPQVRRSLSEKISDSFGIVPGRMPHRTTSLVGDCILDDCREILPEDPFCMLSQNSLGSQSNFLDNGTLAYEREYMQGVLIKERVRTVTRRLSYKSNQSCKSHVKEVKRSLSMDFFKGLKSYYLMLNLQLGIRHSVGKITPVPIRGLRQSDFGERARIKMYFPRKGSQLTPPHYSIDFYWKDYCPMVFRNLRELFRLDAAEYMMSICGDDGLREFSSPGKSGSIFYHSSDDRFVIKTLRKSELKVLLKMLPSYYKHVKDHENTLITKFFGLHRISFRRGKKVRFVVMGNMFCTELHIHRRYDLKGSSHGRFTNKDKIDEGTTLKDLDLKFEFHMDKLLREILFRQLSLDCQFLEAQQIIDYSLLLGLHFRAPEHLMTLLEPPDSMHKADTTTSTTSISDGVASQGEMSIPPRGLLLVTHEPSAANNEPGPHCRGNTLKACSLGDKEVDLLLPGTGRLRVQLGVHMPAEATHKVMQDGVDGSAEVELFEVYDVVLYMGIIDILQEYNMKKKLEHAYKSMLVDPMSISAVKPSVYSKRFINFLEKVFPIEP
ncbi:unnamed protein product [Cuscuta epithymum]|uniref:Phosphatidylinositol 4-phosphate 5-kinase n=1 Tax=Cuscuta epithymum TaxID=186058 RepID=A0AAV0F5A3_9ASTE|nr:unnamed protein product [Cuscuta epithymum]